MEEWSIAILICAFLLGIFAECAVSQSEKRYQQLVKKYNELAIKTGNPQLATTYISDAEVSKIRQLKEAGKIVQAVKLTRTLTELGLVEAKRYVDALVRLLATGDTQMPFPKFSF
jgi:ribosomal protein L7/L12